MMTIEEAVDKIAESFDDGIQASDLWEILPASMELVETFKGLSGPEKKAKVLLIMEAILEKVDLPGWDWLTRKAIMWALPYVIDHMVDAANGMFDF